ncbi:hypothetical protein DUNSADRAFT_11530 [Dunaliella salina]|uniref:Guanylate cyclase domain-containing protein n=1 Tax=Dunaliella salina TaxID=3046 RepID=A0ABQ7GD49_DUNSA|nr:hypothetical protein DUNSADRAFT_11530 [Dunaliella salina]|eukprot:KAF5832535.1 hypothetical protein DUNSADRAFT_11530 [Dunaliella salina]
MFRRLIGFGASLTIRFDDFTLCMHRWVRASVCPQGSADPGTPDAPSSDAGGAASFRLTPLVPQSSFTSPIYASSPDDAPPSSLLKRAAPLDVQQTNLPSSNCERLAATLASPKGVAALPSPSDGPTQPQQAPDWVPAVLEAIPFSVAVVSSDGKEVLHHTCGSEPGAAQALTQTLSCSQAGNPRSFLSALLGDLEGQALQAVRKKRTCWKGSVSVPSVGGPLTCSTSCEDAHPSRCPKAPAPSAPAPSASMAPHAKSELPGGAEMGKAFSSPGQLLHDLVSGGVGGLTTSAAGRAACADSAMMAELAGTAAAAVPESGRDSSGFGANMALTDPGLALPPPPSATKSSLERASLTGCEASEGTRWSGFQEFPDSCVDEERRATAGQGSATASQPRKWPPRASKSMSSASPFSSIKRQSSLLMSEHSIEQIIGSEESKKTKALLKSLAQQARASNGIKARNSKREFTRSSTAVLDSMLTYEASSSASSKLAEPFNRIERSVVQSFDVLLCLLRPTDGEKRAQATLLALAESQLEILSGFLPQHAIQFLALQSTAAVPQSVGQLARAHKGVTLLFMDIVGFTAMSKAVEPQEIMVFLNTLFSLFDQLTNMHRVHKVETAGDCYVVSGGIMSSQQSSDGFQVVAEEEMDPAVSARQVMECAKAMLEVANQVKMPDTHQHTHTHTRLHTGDVVSGVIGSKLPKFSVFGGAMITASRMESTGE